MNHLAKAGLLLALPFVAGAIGMELIGGPCPPDPALYAELSSHGSGG